MTLSCVSIRHDKPGRSQSPREPNRETVSTHTLPRVASTLASAGDLCLGICSPDAASPRPGHNAFALDRSNSEDLQLRRSAPPADSAGRPHQPGRSADSVRRLHDGRPKRLLCGECLAAPRGGWPARRARSRTLQLSPLVSGQPADRLHHARRAWRPDANPRKRGRPPKPPHLPGSLAARQPHLVTRRSLDRHDPLCARHGCTLLPPTGGQPGGSQPQQAGRGAMGGPRKTNRRAPVSRRR